MGVNPLVEIYSCEAGYYALVCCILVHVLRRRCLKQGLPWAILALFLTMRISRDVLEVLLQTGFNQDGTFIEAIKLLDILAFGPLLLVTYMLVIFSIPTPINLFKGVSLVTVIGLAIAMILGGIGQSRIDPWSETMLLTDLGHKLTRAGLVFFTDSYIVTVVLHMFMLKGRPRAQISYKTYFALSTALLLLAVRLAYQWLNEVRPQIFQGWPMTGDNWQWSATSTDWWLYLVMGGIVEWIVVFIYLILGYVTPSSKSDVEEFEETGKWRLVEL
ncbi:hypothetical protein M422DRAFT_255723 [Sphaerobolus stellatus SS14]|uniref:DUF7702 domain-containing protein n=1 Tax=Sphaerobolus stellatus (strain SS14) TaxID=990650 RepID=A0A0C9V2H3_SPHS4|nr:hypothetical protein M422DRAFT_255723 [Sphaerobolus stellatus SS14]